MPGAEPVAELDHRRIPEGSGLAVAGHDPQRLWFVNDSGNRPELIAVNLDTGEHQRLRVDGAKNRDWEDLAGFRYQDEPWLAIADIGDNKARHKKVRVYLLPEPRDPGVRKVDVHATLELEYPDDPRDAESMAIDSATQTLYLLSKREKYPRLYRVALPALDKGKKHKLTLSSLGKVKSIPAPTAADLERPFGKFTGQPTGMAFQERDRRIALLTYGEAYIAHVDDSGSWLDALNRGLCPLAMPRLKQAEAIAMDAGGRVYVSSEGKNAPVYRLDASVCEP